MFKVNDRAQHDNGAIGTVLEVYSANVIIVRFDGYIEHNGSQYGPNGENLPHAQFSHNLTVVS